MKKIKATDLLDQLQLILSTVHSANLSNIQNKDIFIDDKLDKCFDIIRSLRAMREIKELELNNEGID